MAACSGPTAAAFTRQGQRSVVQPRLRQLPSQKRAPGPPDSHGHSGSTQSGRRRKPRRGPLVDDGRRNATRSRGGTRVSKGRSQHGPPRGLRPGSTDAACCPHTRPRGPESRTRQAVVPWGWGTGGARVRPGRRSGPGRGGPDRGEEVRTGMEVQTGVRRSGPGRGGPDRDEGSALDEEEGPDARAVMAAQQCERLSVTIHTLKSG